MPGDGRIWALELERAELPVVRNHKGSDGEMLTIYASSLQRELSVLVVFHILLVVLLQHGLL